MIVFSTGETYVYGLFGADGCECENLEGVFASQDLAEARKLEIQANVVSHDRFPDNPKRAFRAGKCYGDPDLLTVRPLLVIGAKVTEKGKQG